MWSPRRTVRRVLIGGFIIFVGPTIVSKTYRAYSEIEVARAKRNHELDRLRLERQSGGENTSQGTEIIDKKEE